MSVSKATQRALWKSHGSGKFSRRSFASVGKNAVFEAGVLVFHPQNIAIGTNVYIGHYTILKGYHRNRLTIGDNVWIGQGCFMHSAAGITIGNDVGIGPGVHIVTSAHRLEGRAAILHQPLDFAPVVLEDGCDIGTGAVILPGVRIGKGAQVGAGAVVSRDVADYSIVTGVPAKPVRQRVKSQRVTKGSA